MRFLYSQKYRAKLFAFRFFRFVNWMFVCIKKRWCLYILFFCALISWSLVLNRFVCLQKRNLLVHLSFVFGFVFLNVSWWSFCIFRCCKRKSDYICHLIETGRSLRSILFDLTLSDCITVAWSVYAASGRVFFRPSQAPQDALRAARSESSSGACSGVETLLRPLSSTLRPCKRRVEILVSSPQKVHGTIDLHSKRK